ncbi:hypothetical protein [Halomarina rubra]|uniref:Uncharacterized protein n=1 Tax=Halomarina rubra TaxID=2071873 RepID=A0ABD6B1F0_9EURY|nr:hypothetical protein [Halomarina rubra]
MSESDGEDTTQRSNWALAAVPVLGLGLAGAMMFTGSTPGAGGLQCASEAACQQAAVGSKELTSTIVTMAIAVIVLSMPLRAAFRYKWGTPQ